MQLPYYSESPRLAFDALILGPSVALSENPTPITNATHTSQALSQLCVSQQ